MLLWWKRKSLGWSWENWIQFTKADLDTAVSEWHIYWVQRQVLSLKYGSVAKGDNPVTSWQVDFFEPFLPWKECFLLTGVNIYPRYEFVFPEYNASVKTNPCTLTERITAFVLLTLLCLTKHHFTAKEVQQWSQYHRICWLHKKWEL